MKVRPIDTAPREDDATVLIYDGYEGWVVARRRNYSNGAHKWWPDVSGYDPDELFDPTHWASLPDKPE